MSFVSSSVWCFMVMISTMCKSIGSSFFAMHNTASTTMVVNLSANSSRSLVLNAVRHAQQHLPIHALESGRRPHKRLQKLQRLTLRHVESLNQHSRVQTFIQISLRLFQELSDASTVVVVPSPVMSSCATAVLAIITAVGF